MIKKYKVDYDGVFIEVEQHTVSNEEKIEKIYKKVEECLGNIDEFIDSDLQKEFEDERDDILISIGDLKQSLTTQKISEEGKTQLDKANFEISKLSFENIQYKQLLDKIELSEDSLGWYLKVGTEREYTPFEVYNILKELKSIGGNK